MLSAREVCPFVSRCSRLARSPIRLLAVLVLLAGVTAPAQPRAETGARLWLRYERIADAARLSVYRDRLAAVSIGTDSPTGRVIAAELRRGLAGPLGREPVFEKTVGAGSLVVATPDRLPADAVLGWKPDIDRLGTDGFLIRSTRSNGRPLIVITGRTEAGLLYGAFHFLRLLQTGTA